MTGFGVGEVALDEGRIVVEIRSVNHRFLEVRARLPRELAELTLFAEQAARERLRRGRFELSIHTEGRAIAPARLDKGRARAAMLALAELRDEVAPSSELPLSLLSALPDLFVSPTAADMPAVRGAITAAIERAIEAMDRMCGAEGSALCADLRARAEAVAAILVGVQARTETARDAIRKRLREKLSRLLAGSDIVVDAARLEVEVVLLAERSDVAEELTRLASHLEQLERLLASDHEPIGRRLDFMLQEMIREVNTLGSKAQDASVSQQVVAMKVELERLREQVQNVE